MTAQLKICTFNLRVVSENDGENIFFNREGRIIEAVRDHSPDIIGFQEANDYMFDFLRDSLTDYTLIGCGRNADLRGERVPIAFKKSVFEMLRSECFWLSPTPNVPGSRYEDQSNCPRITTAALLKHRDSEQYFWFINTHLDHKSSSARLLGATHLVNYISELGLPFVLTGDLNASPDSPEIALLKEHFTDATENIGGTFHGFGRIEEGTMRQIDYIFTALEAKSSYVLRDVPVNGIYISDHRPVFATLAL